MSIAAGTFGRVLAGARAAHRGRAEVEALERYPWPVALRIAAYVTWVAAMLSMSARVGPDAPRLVAALGLGGIFVKGFHAISVKQCLSTSSKRVAIVVAQSAIAVTLLLLSFCMGSELLLYVVAAELQFVFSFRNALIGTAVLLGAQDAVVVFGHVNLGVAGGKAEYLLASPAGFAFVAAFTRSAVTELVERYRATTLLDELNVAHGQLQGYADEVERLVVSRERNRMAREIHDTLGHYLTVINVQIETAQKLRERDPMRSTDALANAKGMATECLNEVRRSVSALRPAALEDAGLTEAVRTLVDTLACTTPLALHLEVEGDGHLPADVEVAIFRGIQEALTNVRKHSGARNAWVRLHWGPDDLRVIIDDDGRGAEGDVENPVPSTFGLQGMRERLIRAGGSLDVGSCPGGFRVTMTVPTCRRPLPAP